MSCPFTPTAWNPNLCVFCGKYLSVHDAGDGPQEPAEGESDTRQRGIRKDKYMAVVPQPVTTRRVALANEYGATVYDLTADGFTDGRAKAQSLIA